MWQPHGHHCDFGCVLHELHGIREDQTVILSRLDKIMSEQSQLDATAAAIEVDVTNVNTGLGQVVAAVALLQAANPALDFTGVNTALADLGTSAAAVAAEGTSLTPPATS